MKLCKALVILKRHNDLLVYSVGATVLPMIYERKDWNKAINFSCLVACILKSDGRNAFNILKDFILEVSQKRRVKLIAKRYLYYLVQKLKQTLELCWHRDRSVSVVESTKVLYSTRRQVYGPFAIVHDQRTLCHHVRHVPLCSSRVHELF